MLHALPIIPRPVAQGTAQICHVPLCSRDTCISAVGGKSFPRGRFLTTSTGSPAGRPGPQAQWSPGLSSRLNTGSRLCVRPAPVFSPVVLACPVAATAGPAPRNGDNPVHCGMLCRGNKRAWQHPAFVTCCGGMKLGRVIS